MTSLLGLYPVHTAPPNALSPCHPTRAVPAHVGTGPNAPCDTDAAARPVEALALASVGKSTQKLYLANWNTWVAVRAAQGKDAWLQYIPVNPNLTGHCYAHNNQQSTVREYRAAINFFHKLYAG